MYKFEIFKGKSIRNPGWFFRLRAPNGQIMLQSEGYDRRSGAMKGAKRVQQVAMRAIITIIEEKEGQNVC